MRSRMSQEFQNGPEEKIYIREVLFWSPEKFRVLSVTYRDPREGPGGSTRWGHRPQRAAWAKCGRGPAPGGLVHPPHQGPRRLGFGEGAPPPYLGGKLPLSLPWPPP